MKGVNECRKRWVKWVKSERFVTHPDLAQRAEIGWAMTGVATPGVTEFPVTVFEVGGDEHILPGAAQGKMIY